MELQVQKREQSKIKKLLKEGFVPGIVYGKYIDEPVSIQFNKNEFIKLYKQAGTSTPITLKWDNFEQLVLIHDYQLDPVKDTLIHTDFLTLKKWEKVKAMVSIVVEWIEKLQKQWLEANVVKNEIEVEAIPSKLPNEIKIDVSELKDGENLSVADIKLDTEVEVITPAEEAVVVVYNPSANVAEEETETIEEETETTEE